MNKMLKSFVLEVYNFLHTVIVFNPYIMKVLGEQYMLRNNGEPITDETFREHPYIKTLLGEYEYLIDAYGGNTIYNIPEELLVVVDSLDTNEPIVLNRETLEDHVFTRQLHRLPGMFKNLCAKYPERTEFIKCCLFPVNESDILVPLLDFEENIVGYRPREENYFKIIAHGAKTTLPEYERISILNALNQFLDRFVKVWHVPEYLAHEKYAADVFNAMLFSIVPLVVIEQRIKNMNTSLAHSDLIWLQLEAEGLPDYRDILTREQELYLYKNIVYLKRVRGSHTSILDLVDNLLKPAGLNVYAKQIVATQTTQQPSTCLPTPVVLTRNVVDANNHLRTLLEGKFESFSNLYNKELANGLEPGWGDSVEKQFTQFTHMNVSRLPTKLLELGGRQYGLRVARAYLKFALETLMYWVEIREVKSEEEEELLKVSLTISFDDISNTFELTLRNALLLLYYSIFQIHPPRIVLPSDSSLAEKFIGAKLLVGGEIIKLTQFNIDVFQTGQEVVLIGPVRLKREVWFSKPYKLEEMVIEDDMIGAYHLSEFFELDANDAPRVRPETEISELESLSEAISLIDNLFTTRIKDTSTAEHFTDIVVRDAYNALASQVMLNPTPQMTVLSDETGTEGPWSILEEGVHKDIVIDDLFFTNEVMAEIIASVENGENRVLGYEDLARSIFKELFSNSLYFFEEDRTNADEYRRLMLELVKHLCSYDVAFLDNESGIQEHTSFGKTYIAETSVLETGGIIQMYPTLVDADEVIEHVEIPVEVYAPYVDTPDGELPPEEDPEYPPNTTITVSDPMETDPSSLKIKLDSATSSSTTEETGQLTVALKASNVDDEQTENGQLEVELSSANLDSVNSEVIGFNVGLRNAALEDAPIPPVPSATIEDQIITNNVSIELNNLTLHGGGLSNETVKSSIELKYTAFDDAGGSSNRVDTTIELKNISIADNIQKENVCSSVEILKLEVSELVRLSVVETNTVETAKSIVDIRRLEFVSVR